MARTNAVRGYPFAKPAEGEEADSHDDEGSDQIMRRKMKCHEEELEVTRGLGPQARRPCNFSLDNLSATPTHPRRSIFKEIDRPDEPGGSNLASLPWTHTHAGRNVGRAMLGSRKPWQGGCKNDA